MLATKTEVKMSSQSASSQNGIRGDFSIDVEELSAVQHPIVGTESFQNDVNEFLCVVCTGERSNPSNFAVYGL